MEMAGLGKRVQIFVEERDHVRGGPVYIAILERLRAEGAAGATVTRGIAGFGAHSRIHQATLVDLASSLPLVITWIDSPERVDRLLPAICALVPEGLVTVEAITIAKYSHRDLAAMQPRITVGQLMTRDVVRVRADTPLAETVSLLVGRDFRALPVVDEAGRLVGIVTNGDLVERGGLGARLELLGAMDDAARAAIIAEAHGRSAGDLMTPDPVSVGSDEPMERALELMARRHLKRLPVVDRAGKLEGIISRVDLLRAVGESYPAPEDGGDAPAGSAHVVGEVMSRHAPVVREDARLAELLDVVVSTRLNRAVVIDAAGEVKGVVSDADVLSHLEPGARPPILRSLMRRGWSAGASSDPAAAKAGDLIRTPPVTVPASMPIGEAIQRMIEARHKVLPVVDERGVLQGIVDRAHLLEALRSGDMRT